MEEQPFSTLTRGAESNPARVLWREVARLKIFIFKYSNLNGFLMSIETDVSLVQFNSELN
jgi:hypothetical protein